MRPGRQKGAGIRSEAAAEYDKAFHKRTTAAPYLLGIPLSTSTAHAFCSLELSAELVISTLCHSMQVFHHFAGHRQQQ